MSSEKENKKSFVLSILKALLYFITFYTLFSVFVIFSFNFINPPTSSFIELQRKTNLLDFTINDNIKQTWMPINKISPNIILAIIASEDQRFFDHNGFDFIEIEKAINDMQNDKRVRGASTISQQVAKNMFLFPAKNWVLIKIVF